MPNETVIPRHGTVRGVQAGAVRPLPEALVIAASTCDGRRRRRAERDSDRRSGTDGVDHGRLRTDGNPVSLPDEWTAASPDVGPARYRFVADFPVGTEFWVTVAELDAGDVVRLGVSLLSGDERDVRHDYRVGEYGRIDAALEDAEALVDFITERIRDGTIRVADPDPEVVGRLVRQFARETADDRRSRLGGWLRSLLRDDLP